jgi:hypothetical protein
MQFRVTNTRMAAEEIPAAHPSALLAALRRFMRSQLRTQGAGGHPLLALRRRFVQIDAWETERLARPDIAQELRRVWRLQADTWRAQARDAAGVGERWALQVQSSDGLWRSLAPAGVGEVWLGVADDPAPIVRDAWERAARVIDHLELLGCLAGWVAEPESESPAVAGLSPHANGERL